MIGWRGSLLHRYYQHGDRYLGTFQLLTVPRPDAILLTVVIGARAALDVAEACARAIRKAPMKTP